ncbi:MAG: transglycosylase SLT domain-containing protein [Alphaproteobacteria bacterium]|nr:transglycosylase SLT domain-containing protein [Alphaproteobacteria bacterium]
MKLVKFNFSRFGAITGFICALGLPLLQTGSSINTATQNAPLPERHAGIEAGTVSEGARSFSVRAHDLLKLVSLHLPSFESDESLPRNARQLSSGDTAKYRALFEAVRNGDDDAIKDLAGEVDNRGLVGVALGERYVSAHCCVDYKHLRQWLKHYSGLPQALTIYTRALALRGNADPLPPEPTTGNTIRARFPEREPSFSATVPLAYENVKLRSDDKQLAERVNELIRLTRPSQALRTLEAALKQRRLAPAFEAHVRAAIAASYYFEGIDDKAVTTLEGRTEIIPLAQWISGLVAWRQQDYARADRMFSALSANDDIASWDSAAAGFWAARARTVLGDDSGARAMLEKAAEQKRTFYGMLAQQALGHDIALSFDLPRLGSRQLRALAAKPAGWRALALLQVGEKDLAEAELRRLHPGNDDALQEAMLAVAHESGMPALLMQLGSSIRPAMGEFYDAALYPVPPWQPAQGFVGDQALLYAMMRHESRFEPGAKSYRGARGLMQLMPRTASVMAGSKLQADESHLFDPVINISLGQRYVGHLAARPQINNNLLMLLTAYNSGPSKLARWMRDTNYGDDPLLFVESLPVRETRDYIEHVLANYWIYRAQLEQPLTSLAELAQGEWPRAQFMPAVVKKTREVMAASNIKLASSIAH